VFSLDHKEPDAEHRQLDSRKPSARSRTPVSPPCTAGQPRGGADAGGRPRHLDRGTRPDRGADRGHRRRGLFEPDAGQPGGPGRGERVAPDHRRGTRRRSPTAWRQGAPEHALSPPVPIVATIRWAVDGEKHIDTVDSAGPAKPSTSASPAHAGPVGGRRARRKAGDDSACSHQPHSVSTLTPARGADARVSGLWHGRLDPRCCISSGRVRAGGEWSTRGLESTPHVVSNSDRRARAPGSMQSTIAGVREVVERVVVRAGPSSELLGR
jgi:hypothetical protein